MANEVAPNNKGEITYSVGEQEIKLSPTIIRQFVTKGNNNITDAEAINFMMLCKYAELNPFLNDAYLIKYGNSPAQMVTSKEALMKRANRQPDYKGITSGIVVFTKDEEVRHKKGQLIYPNEKLLGAWAEVKRSNFEEPIYVEVGFEEYNTGKSMWAKMPANMINKVAEATALRKAYPDQMGAMYIEEESVVNDTIPQDITPIEETTQPTIEERIKELRQLIRDKNPDFKTLKAVDEKVAKEHSVEDISVLNDFAIFTTLKEMAIGLDKGEQQVADVDEEG